MNNPSNGYSVNINEMLLTKKERGQLKKKRQRVHKGQGSTQDYIDIFGADVKIKTREQDHTQEEVFAVFS